MANPFTEPFNCCTCPEPPDYDPEVDDPLDTYVNLCGCPSVSVVCESEQKTATLCGFAEYTNTTEGIEASEPPKKYRRKEGDLVVSGPGCNYSGSIYFQYAADDCSDTSTDAPKTISGGGCSTVLSFNVIEVESAVQSTTVWQSVFTGVDTTTRTHTLSDEDTEADALDRAIATEGNECSSLYQLRTTSFSFTQRTSTYTATASNLVIGVQYEGCVRIRRREAYSGTVPLGADTTWYDVEPDTIAAFTATATEEEVATDVALPNVQGYEYEIVGAYVWPVSAGCDCPTSYVAP